MEVEGHNSNTMDCSPPKIRKEGVSLQEEYLAQKEPHLLLESAQKIVHVLIKRLNNLCKARVRDFYSEQYAEVMDILHNAYQKRENQSLILLARSKLTMHAFISKVEEDIKTQLKEPAKKGQKPDSQLLVVRLNSILSKSEPALIAKFAECLGLKARKNEMNSTDMVELMKEFFETNKQVKVLFVLEDVEFYVENTKQHLLYKILDTFQYVKIQFVFICTSTKIDVANSFEKRIKSRFSNRSVLFYEHSFELFKEVIKREVQDIQLNELPAFGQMTSFFGQLVFQSNIQDHHQLFRDEVSCEALLEEQFDRGKDFEYLCMLMKLALSFSLTTLRTRMSERNPDLRPEECSPEEQEEAIGNWPGEYAKGLVKAIQQRQEYERVKVLKTLPKASLVVLVAVKKVADAALIFNFEAVWHRYEEFYKSNSQGFGFQLSKQSFLKIFLDLVEKGFLRSESRTDVLNTNNKISIGMRLDSLNEMLESNLGELNLPKKVEQWLRGV